jgi:hypothetical protein
VAGQVRPKADITYGHAGVEMTEIKPPNYLLSVTSASSGDAVTIHADKEGLLALRARIDVLLAKLDRDSSDHEHLRSAQWAGFELTTSMLASERTQGHQTVHHVDICAWNPEWKKHYGL